MKIAIIPARGGSKRIPRKNLRPFAGKPILGYSIEAARTAGLFDRILVSTDSDEIAGVAREFGAETPFLRPAELSDDHTATSPVVDHAIRWVVEHDGPVETACCIYATAPFLRVEDLREADRRLAEGGFDFVFPVTTFPSSIFRALRRTGERLEMFWPEHGAARSQDLEEAYHDAGQFYFGTAEAFGRYPVIFAARCAPVVLPRHLVHDLDTEEDWQRA